MNLNGDLAELVAVCSGVVAAEKEIATTGENNAYVRLRAAAVTTVGCIENWNR
jgi:hypothetical protein